jgi:hypothetical protein
MLCTEEMGTLLSRYVDEELGPEERKSVEVHLEKCASCRDVLNLFQRNDNVLNNALVGEAFGAQTVDAVMTEIKRLEEPTIVAPMVEEPPSQPAQIRQIIQVTKMWPFAAAAGLMVACFAGFLLLNRMSGGDGADRVAVTPDRPAPTDAIFSALIERIGALSEEIRDVNARNALRGAKENVCLAYQNGRGIVVQANYASETFGTFTLYRCGEISPGVFEKKWTLLKDALGTPYFKDESVVPGNNYMYFWRAFYRNPADPKKPFIESVPVMQMIPFAGGLDPRTSLRIRFIAATPDNAQATFEVSRYVGQRLVSRIYQVKTGESIGAKEKLQDGEVDFATRLVLQSVVRKEDIIHSDANVFASRPSRQAVLKPESKTRGLPDSLLVWIDSDLYVPLAK